MRHECSKFQLTIKYISVCPCLRQLQEHLKRFVPLRRGLAELGGQGQGMQPHVPTQTAWPIPYRRACKGLNPYAECSAEDCLVTRDQACLSYAQVS